MSRKSHALAALLCALFVQGVAGSPPALTLPISVSGGTGEFITVPSMTDGKTVVWYALDPGLSVFPAELLKDTHTAVVTCGKAGTYRLLAITAAGDEPSKPFVCTVVIKAPTASSPSPPKPASVPAPASALLFDGPQTCGPNGCPVSVPNTFFLRRSIR